MSLIMRTSLTFKSHWYFFFCELSSIFLLSVFPLDSWPVSYWFVGTLYILRKCILCYMNCNFFTRFRSFDFANDSFSQMNLFILEFLNYVSSWKRPSNSKIILIFSSKFLLVLLQFWFFYTSISESFWIHPGIWFGVQLRFHVCFFLDSH